MSKDKPTYQELEMKIQELEKKSEFFQLLADNTVDWEIFRDTSGKIIYCNKAFERITGFNTSDFISGKVTEKDFVHPDDWNQFQMELEQVKKQVPIMDFEFRIIRHDLQKRTVNFCSQPVYRNDVFIGIRSSLRDITDFEKDIKLQKAKENTEKNLAKIKIQNEEIHFNNERLESLLKVSQYKTESIQELLDLALNEAIKLTKSKIGYIYHYNNDTKQFILNTWSKDVMQECAITNQQTVYNLDKTGIWGEAVRQKKPIIINDFPADNPLKKGYPKGHVELLKYLTIPVIVDNKIVAVAAVANKEEDYDNTDIRQLTLLMDNVWKISERLKLIDKLTRAKENAERNELKYSSLFNSLQEGVYLHEIICSEAGKAVDYKIIDANPISEEYLNIKRDDAIGKTATELYRTEKAPFIEIYAKVAETGEPCTFEEYFAPMDKYFLISAFSPQKGQFATAFLDITERKNFEKEIIKAKEKAEESEKRLKFAIDSGQFGIWDWNVPDNIMVWNDRMFELYGINQSAFTNTVEAWENGLHPEDKQRAIDECNAALKGESDFNTTFKVVQPNGTILHLKANGLVIRDDANKLLRMIGINSDISKNIKAEQELKESEEHLKRAERIGKIGYFEINFELRKAFWSDEIYKIYELDQNSFIPDNKNYIQYIHPDDKVKLLENFNPESKEYKDLNMDYRIITKNNNLKWLHSFSTVEKNKHNIPVKMFGIVQDITEIKLLHEEIKTKNKELGKLNADKDRFISILAHDLKNPFNSLLGFSNLLLRNIHKYDREKIEKQLTIINQVSQQTYNLLMDLLLWSKAQSNNIEFEPEVCNFNDICFEILELEEEIAKEKNITIYYYATEHISLKADINMIKTVMRNLISNAIKYTHFNGCINIYAEKNHENVTITVSDNGIGLDKENISKLWQFSENSTTIGTNGESGTGFGLVLCKQFVEKHGGEIWVESEVDNGTNFKFTLPLHL